MSLFDYVDEKDTKPVPIPELPPVRKPLTITTLTLRIKAVMESDFGDVWVVGQVSNLSRPRSGHVYLTLKDEGAQLPAVIWKSTLARIKFDLKDGMEIFCRGRLDVFPPHGKYQMIVNSLEPKGVGALELAFRQLHDKLAKAGLFDPARKRPLPKPIRKVAVISSPSGAAVRDFLQVLARRTRQVDVVIVPARVQGDGAAAEIAEALRRCNEFGAAQGIDCLVVTRGGGSVEDLWAFNEEVLVRAVAASKIPVISAVGHEIDVSLCDLAADVRALTPSEAAERLASEDAELARSLVFVRRRMENSMAKRLRTLRERILFYEKHPVFARPERLIENRRRMVDLLEERLERSVDRRLQTVQDRLAKTAATLQALSPLAVLARGFSVTTNESGRVIRRTEDVVSGDRIRTRLSDGTVESVVQQATALY